jgi:hypothetical protein
LPGEETRPWRLLWLADQSSPGAATATRPAPSEAGADGAAVEADARLRALLHKAAERGRAGSVVPELGSGVAEGGPASTGGGGDDPTPKPVAQEDHNSVESRETGPAREPAPQQALVERPGGAATALTEDENHRRWLVAYQRSEIQALSAHVEELERRLRWRTIMLAMTAAFGLLGAVATLSLMVARFAEPPPAGQASGTAPGVPAGSGGPGLDPPAQLEPAAGDRDGGPVAEETPARGAEPLPAKSEGTDAADSAAPTPVAPGPAARPAGATIGATERPVAPSEQTSPEPAIPPARAAKAPGASSARFGVYFYAVRPQARVAEEWQRLLERYPDILAGLELRPSRSIAVAGTGTLYAIEGGAFVTRSEAQAVCDRLRARGESCRVVGP